MSLCCRAAHKAVVHLRQSPCTVQHSMSVDGQYLQEHQWSHKPLAWPKCSQVNWQAVQAWCAAVADGHEQTCLSSHHDSKSTVYGCTLSAHFVNGKQPKKKDYSHRLGVVAHVGRKQIACRQCYRRRQEWRMCPYIKHGRKGGRKAPGLLP